MEGETRNVQIEAARIARGPVADLDTIKASDFDALFMPGGFGAAKNLSSFAFEGPTGSILPELKRIIQEFPPPKTHRRRVHCPCPSGPEPERRHPDHRLR